MYIKNTIKQMIRVLKFFSSFLGACCIPISLQDANLSSWLKESFECSSIEKPRNTVESSFGFSQSEPSILALQSSAKLRILKWSGYVYLPSSLREIAAKNAKRSSKTLPQLPRKYAISFPCFFKNNGRIFSQ